MSELPPRTPFETGLEVFSLLGLLAGVVLLLSAWPNLPDRVPGHYDAAGNVTRYDPKGSLWLLVGVSVGLYGLMGAVNAFPQLWNLPAHGAADRSRQLGLARAFMRCLKAFVVWLFTFILWISVRVAQGAASGLPWWFLPLALLAPLVLTVGWLYLANRPPHGAPDGP